MTDSNHAASGRHRPLPTAAHDRMTELASQLGTTPDDPAVADARNAVALARQRLEHIRREHIRGSAGRTDVHTAEAKLDAALAQVDTATGGTAWR